MRALIVLVFSVLALTSGAASAQQDTTLVLEHAQVFTGEQTVALHDVNIVIVDGRIQSVDHLRHVRADSSTVRRIDLHGAWVLPGLIDAHVHVSDIAGVHRMLSLGITTGRSMLTTGYEDVGLAALYARGDKDIPAILSAGYPVVAHPMAIRPDIGALFLNNPDLDDLRFAERIGIDGARRIVLSNAARHVDWIKVFANGRAGVLSADPKARDLNDAELAAAVQQATSLGIPAAAHAFTDDGVAAAVDAGVRTIEHGSLMTEPTIELLRKRGVCFVPTLSPLYELSTVGPDATADDKALAARGQSMLESARAALAIARRLGVAVIAGTDTGYDPDGATLPDEIQHLADAGFSPGSALDAATSRSAACLGIDKKKGAIRPGLDADLVVYASDPRNDLHILKSPQVVITRGGIYLNNLGKAAN